MPKKTNNRQKKSEISYQAMINWIEKAEQYKGLPESRLFIRNAETYAKSLLLNGSKNNMADALKRIETLKLHISQ